ncbi:LPS export ABC transporter periplasmic protein LptC [Candidatus Colwellia aromaticivorans]|uniref:LPS export ABC transporter periplasmic protein LptC n=1 Tax=Candidatus Colwellia aromaticivorans TaxID=2267621 RepID=UPI000DF1B2B1|nr:LPS export ABC transporter periplasmic protein LptC [Candidatus Colwellia aromaticivorans]
MTRLNFLALLILLLGGMAYAIIEWRYAQKTPGESIESELTPDFIAEALNSDIYTQLGQLSHSVVADRMEHYAKLEVTHFELPNYILYPTNNSQSKNSSTKKQNYPWKLSAKEATLYKNNRVILNHRVHLTSTDENSLIQEIHCKYLELDLNTNIISSDQTVMVQGKDFTMYGSGLIIDLNTKQMTLTEHVRTIYKKNNS